ncbi:MAG: hypothetical protein ACP5RD_02120 [bacterium]
MDSKYLNMVDQILKKIDQNKINLFQINNKDFYLKIKISNNNKNLKNESSNNKNNFEKKSLEHNNQRKTNTQQKNLQEKLEDGYKIVFYEENNQKYADIISTLVGKFYLADNKDLKINKGSIIKANTILGYIEILNISYYIKLNMDVEVVEIYAEDLPFVQYSSKILKLKILN